MPAGAATTTPVDESKCDGFVFGKPKLSTGGATTGGGCVPCVKSAASCA